MKFNRDNISKYNVMEVKERGKCSICNEDTKYMDYFCNNKFCSSECQDKYYNWLNKNKEKDIC